MSFNHLRSDFHSLAVLSEWNSFVSKTTSGAPEIELVGCRLDIASIVAVAR
jgi:hypothetical protein